MYIYIYIYICMYIYMYIYIYIPVTYTSRGVSLLVGTNSLAVFWDAATCMYSYVRVMGVRKEKKNVGMLSCTNSLVAFAKQPQACIK